MPVVEVKDLVIRYGDVAAVNGTTWHVDRGEVVGLLGGNGAGKSSSLRALAGINPPTSGILKLSGNDMTTPEGAEAARRILGYCPDVGGLLRQSTVREHVALALALHGMTDQWPAAMELVERFDLLRVFDRVTQGFSHGMSRRLSVMLAVITAKDVLILDEPFDGVDPTGVDVTLEVIKEAADGGLAVVISTHLLDLITASSSRVIVMNRGQVVDEAPSRLYTGEEGKRKYADLLSGKMKAKEIPELIPAEIAAEIAEETMSTPVVAANPNGMVEIPEPIISLNESEDVADSPASDASGEKVSTGGN